MPKSQDTHVPAELVEQLTKVTELGTDELQALEESLVTAFKEARDGEQGPDLEVMEALADEIDKVRAEGQVRVAAAEETAAKAAEISNRVEAPVEEPKAEETPAEPEEEEKPTEEAPASEETPTEEPAETEEPVEQPEAVAASAPPVRRPSLAELNRNRSKKATPRPTAQPERMALVAAGDVAHVGTGEPFPDMVTMGEAVRDKAAALNVGTKPGRFHIARAQWFDAYPNERRFSRADVDGNSHRLEAVLASLGGMDAVVAAGGLCAPVDIRYELFTVGDQRRPIRDALVRFAATRGGIQFNEPPTLSDIPVTGTRANRAVNVYTEAEDTDGNVYPKGVYEIACGQLVTKEVAAIVARGRTGNFLRRFNPEAWDANWDLILTAHARVAENFLWDSIEADSTAITAGLDASTSLGTTRHVLRAIGLAVEGLRSRHRISPSVPIRMIAPDWLQTQMREDLAAQAPGDNVFAVADAELERFFSTRGVTTTWSPDAGGQTFGNQAAGALNPWPDVVQVLLFPEGNHLFLDGGELNFGLEIRDTTLNDTNDVEAFTETFEETAPVGPESLALTIDTCPSGRSTLPVAYDPCTLGS